MTVTKKLEKGVRDKKKMKVTMPTIITLMVVLAFLTLQHLRKKLALFLFSIPFYSGVVCDIGEEVPVEIFQHYFKNTVCQHIVDDTHCYGDQYRRNWLLSAYAYNN